MDYDSTSSSAQTVTAFFDSRTEAQNAMDRLRNEGISTGEIRLIEGSTAGTDRTAEHKGFWESLGDLFMPDGDRSTYAEGLSRGGYVVSVRTTAANRDVVLDILDDEGTVNLDEREATWRSEGWSGYRTADSDVDLRSGIAGVGGSTAGYASTTTATSAGYTDRDRLAATTTGATARTLDEDGRIDVIQEELRVGKRDVSHGRVRVRSYVVEEPVSESVNLRSERVEIERRPVDRAVVGDEALFLDRTIEAEESAEEAVISKTARVKEEINLKRDVSNRTETVSDTVRHTEVEVEDERSESTFERERTLTGTTGRTERDL